MHTPWTSLSRTLSQGPTESVVLCLSLSTVLGSAMFLVWFILRRGKRAQDKYAPTEQDLDMVPKFERVGKKSFELGEDIYHNWSDLDPQHVEGLSPQEILCTEELCGGRSAGKNVSRGPECGDIFEEGRRVEPVMRLDLVSHCTAALGWQQEKEEPHHHGITTIGE